VPSYQAGALESLNRPGLEKHRPTVRKRTDLSGAAFYKRFFLGKNRLKESLF